MKITLLWPGRCKFDYIQYGLKDYCQRLEHFCQFQILTTPAGAKRNLKSPKEIQDTEAKHIKKNFTSRDFLIALDSSGKQLDSQEFAEFINRYSSLEGRNLVFIIGGAYGLAPDLTKAAHFVLSLSKMTLTHEMIRLLLVEQIYRALCILNGHPYHH